MASPARQQQLPTRLAANLYLVLGIVVLVLTSLPETSALSRYGIGIVVEISLAGVALLFMRIGHLSIRQTARLRHPERRVVLLSLLSVPGLWMTGVVLNLLSVAVLGYTTPATPAQFPGNALEAAALALVTMIVAPVCEELMFRGYVQRAYERRHGWIGVVVGGLIFAIYHLRFQGVFSLIPVALALGFVAWRSQSVLPGVFLHAGFNAIATLLLIATSFLPVKLVTGLTASLVCLGALMTPVSYGALWVLWRTTQPDRDATLMLPRPFLRWAWAIPMAALMAVYGYSAITEVLVNRFPERILDTVIELRAPIAWEEQVRWHYSVQDRLGNRHGQAVCDRRHAAGTITIDCESSHEGFDLTPDIPGLVSDLDELPLERLPFGLSGLQSALKAEPTTWSVSASWSETPLALAAYDADHEALGAGHTLLHYPARERGSDLLIDRSDRGSSTVSLPSDTVFMPYEWAWRAGALDFRMPYGGNVALVRFDENNDIQVTDGFLIIRGGEPAWTPEGNHVTWKVSLTWRDASGREQTQTAWYDAQAPHTLVRYDDGAVSYVLTTTERMGSRPARDYDDLLQ